MVIESEENITHHLTPGELGNAAECTSTILKRRAKFLGLAAIEATLTGGDGQATGSHLRQTP